MGGVGVYGDSDTSKGISLFRYEIKGGSNIVGLAFFLNFGDRQRSAYSVAIGIIPEIHNGILRVT